MCGVHGIAVHGIAVHGIAVAGIAVHGIAVALVHAETKLDVDRTVHEP
jgi:hypothetical protein